MRERIGMNDMVDSWGARHAECSCVVDTVEVG